MTAVKKTCQRASHLAVISKGPVAQVKLMMQVFPSVFIRCDWLIENNKNVKIMGSEFDDLILQIHSLIHGLLRPVAKKWV